MMNCNSLFRLMGFLTLMMWNCGSFARKILRSGIHESVLLFRWINLEIGLFGTMAMLQILEPLLGSLYLLFLLLMSFCQNAYMILLMFFALSCLIIFTKFWLYFFMLTKNLIFIILIFFIYKYYDIDFFMSNRNFSEERLKCL